MTKEEQDSCELGLHRLASDIHNQMTKNGFNESSKLEDIALMHSELSEAVENIRHSCLPSDHIPEFTGEEEEIADLIIRALHYTKKRKLRIIEAVFAKCAFNLTRPYKHSKTI